MKKGLTWFNITSIVLGFAFLYIPILLLVIYSFNASRLVTVWAGFSTQWYWSLLENEQLIDAAWVTLRIAFFSSLVATVLGTMAALALTRYGRFGGRTLFSGMIYAPLVMPEVITGLSLLLLFVAVNFDRGFWTVLLAHITFTMCFVAVVVQSRLVTPSTARWKRRRWISGARRSRPSSRSLCRSSCRRWCPASCWPSPCRWMTS